MTLLYRLDTGSASIAEIFGVSAGDDPWAGGYAAPGSFAPIVTGGREFIAGPRKEHTKPRITPRLWGVPPPPSAHASTRGVATVRNAASPFWIGNLRNSEFRCLIPATSFMEWGKASPGDGRRAQHWIAPGDQPLFAFAGVWKDSEVPSFAMMTCEPNAAYKAMGKDSMPVILPSDERARHIWLYGSWDRASTLLQPYPSSLMRELDSAPAR
ncbi:DUF159 family protein [Altererythrobacter luteolus]|uniref:Abasic site processing protein n=1 Tax=Pontixanthobacter luteolus TaxID=295089 RepID=A0A6I4UZ99_9SPHN|nr:SOS response-associated peptidase family protein [Pontixanthobacter luteolus]MXP45860.1 DUF159 family protein [Pontixanthobacter luteolus]